jgi:UDP-3-O-[3-hydroxymyristoyl] glucosamine N-acyltransferase
VAVDASAVEDAAARGREDLLMATMSEIAGWIGAKAPAVETEITEVSNMEGATACSLVFAIDSATLTAALGSKAGAILASNKLELSEPDPRIVWASDPRRGFALIAKRLKGKGFEAGIHPTAVIGEGVKIGVGTSVGPRVVLGDGVVIGNDCNILAGVTVYSGTVVGDGVVVQAGAVLGSTGFGYVRNAETGEYLVFPQQGRLYVEDNVEIGANTTIDRGALGETRIGRGTKIDNLVHIGHNCLIGKNVIIAAQTGISGSSVVEDGAILGGQVGIGEHATVGAGVILGGGAGVLSGKKMRGPGEVFWGRPARPLKEYLRDLARLKKR